jgi:hypothetical protein
MSAASVEAESGRQRHRPDEWGLAGLVPPIPSGLCRDLMNADTFRLTP